MSREKKFKPETLLVIQLYLNGKSIKEIAHLQKKTPNSVSAIIHRARKHMPELEKEFLELAKIREQYIKLEKTLLEKKAVWDALGRDD